MSKADQILVLTAGCVLFLPTLFAEATALRVANAKGVVTCEEVDAGAQDTPDPFRHVRSDGRRHMADPRVW
jgi:hypothetical protein